MEPFISVIICTHNPRQDYLQKVLQSLKNQTLSLEQWELLLIDNASNTVLAKEVDLQWHLLSRHIREEKLGLTHARLRGIEESTGEVLVFVDDDNVLAPDYLSEGMNIANKWTMLGVWGGQLIAEFEDNNVTPRARKFWDGSLKKDCWGNIPERRLAPPGAGVFIRRIVAEKYKNLCDSSEIRLLLGRSGEDLSSDEDIDISYTACDIGLGMGRFIKLKLTHLIPSQRTNIDYLRKLTEGFGYSSTLLNYVRSGYTYRQSKLQPIFNFYKALRLKGEQKEIFQLRLHGKKRALNKIKTLENNKFSL